MTKLLLILFFSCSFLLSGFDKSEEQKILSVVDSMVTSINEKDAEKYIQTLGDYFIKVRYGDKDFIRNNINDFGHADLLETKVVAMSPYISRVYYRLIHTNERNKKTTFYGQIVLEKSNDGWKVYFVTQEEE